MKHVLGILTAVGLVAAAMGPATAQSVAEKRVAYMKGLGANLGALAKIAKGEAEYTPAAVGNAEHLAKAGKEMTAQFPANSGGPDTRAKAEIWSNWAGFEKAAKEFETATAALPAAVQSGDKAQIGAAVGAVGKTCGGCHDAFRAPPKS